MSSRLPIVIAIVGIVIVSISAPIVSGSTVSKQLTLDHNTTNGTESDSEYSLSELREPGRKMFDGGPPSQRSLDQYSSVVVRDYPVGLGSSEWSYLERGETVNSNRLTIRTIRFGDESDFDETFNLTIVFWQTEQETVQRGNETVTETRLTNVSTYSETVEAGRGYGSSNVTLPPHYDDTYRATMWVEGQPSIRWTFEHKSVESSRAIPISTVGDYWSYTAINLLTWILGGVIVAAPSAVGLLRRAGRGPNKSVVWWGLVLGGTTAVFGSSAYVWTASLIATIPPVVGVVVAGIVFIIMLETVEFGITRLAFIQLFTSDAESTNLRGEIAETATGARLTTLTVASTDGETLAIHDGIRPFVARLWTGGTPLRGVEKLDYDFSLSSPRLSITSPVADELIFVHDDSDEILRYDPERLDLEIDPWDDDGSVDWGTVWEIATTGAVGISIGTIGADAIGLPSGPIVGVALGIVAIYLRRAVPIEGSAQFRPAPAHTDDAVATALKYQKEVSDYETLDTALRELVSERNRRDTIVERLEEMDSESVVHQSVRRSDGADSTLDILDDSETDSGDPSTPVGGDD
jgi:hypothetical protein